MSDREPKSKAERSRRSSSSSTSSHQLAAVKIRGALHLRPLDHPDTQARQAAGDAIALVDVPAIATAPTPELVPFVLELDHDRAELTAIEVSRLLRVGPRALRALELAPNARGMYARVRVLELAKKR